MPIIRSEYSMQYETIRRTPNKKARFEEAGFAMQCHAGRACADDAYCTPWLNRKSS
jgi:hypothetical protein